MRVSPGRCLLTTGSTLSKPSSEASWEASAPIPLCEDGGPASLVYPTGASALLKGPHNVGQRRDNVHFGIIKGLHTLRKKSNLSKEAARAKRHLCKGAASGDDNVGPEVRCFHFLRQPGVQIHQRGLRKDQEWAGIRVGDLAGTDTVTGHVPKCLWASTCPRTHPPPQPQLSRCFCMSFRGKVTVVGNLSIPAFTLA